MYLKPESQQAFEFLITKSVAIEIQGRMYYVVRSPAAKLYRALMREGKYISFELASERVRELIGIGLIIEEPLGSLLEMRINKRLKHPRRKFHLINIIHQSFVYQELLPQPVVLVVLSPLALACEAMEGCCDYLVSTGDPRVKLARQLTSALKQFEQTGCVNGKLSSLLQKLEAAFDAKQDKIPFACLKLAKKAIHEKSDQKNTPS